MDDIRELKDILNQPSRNEEEISRCVQLLKSVEVEKLTLNAVMDRFQILESGIHQLQEDVPLRKDLELLIKEFRSYIDGK